MYPLLLHSYSTSIVDLRRVYRSVASCVGCGSFTHWAPIITLYILLRREREGSGWDICHGSFKIAFGQCLRNTPPFHYDGHASLDLYRKQSKTTKLRQLSAAVPDCPARTSPSNTAVVRRDAYCNSEICKTKAHQLRVLGDDCLLGQMGRGSFPSAESQLTSCGTSCGR